MSGILYIISTPIGNLEDFSHRAERILKEVSVIAAEDTRHTKILLTRYQINTALTSYHDFNKEKKTPILISKLQSGESVALVADAGTPTISDPGYFLIKQAILANIAISPIPGPVAAITALSVSGLPTDRFSFEGFLPKKKGQKTKRLQELQSDARTLIFYESPYRIIAVLEELRNIFGKRRAVFCRELTKKFEEIIRGDVSEILTKLKDRKILGEITLIIEGNKK